MTTVLLSEERLSDLIARFASCHIAVLGDFFLDKYLDIDTALEEFSVETGKPAHQVAAVRCSPGAAGTVVSNLAALGAGTLHSVGFTGDDGEAYELRRGLADLNCSTDHLHTTSERFTPTYLKPRDKSVPGLAGEHSRLDTKNRQSTPPNVQQAVINSLAAVVRQVDAVIVMDQVENRNCGIVTEAVRSQVIDFADANSHVVFWADSRRHIREFRHVIIKPNEFEAVGCDNPQPGNLVDAGELQNAVALLRRQTSAPVFVTRGAEGMFVTDPEWTAIPSVRVDGDIDTTGAGDSVTAGCVLALCAGANCAEAAVVGNLVASITVQQLATTGTARPEQLLPRLRVWREQHESI